MNDRNNVAEPPSRAAKIRDALHDAIVDRRLTPGTKLVEDEVGTTFKASRTVVRAALQSLAHSGVVTLERNRGAYVSKPTPEEARQIFAARRMIEPRLVVDAAEKITPEGLAALDEHVAREQAAVRARGANARRAEIRASGELHITIARIAGNELLSRFLGELIAVSSLVIALYGRTGASSCARDEHSRIVDALRQRDAALAAELMRTHLDHIEADLEFGPEDAVANIGTMLKG